MSRRKNGTLRAASAIGINPYGWGNGREQVLREIKKSRRRQPVRDTENCSVRLYQEVGVKVNE